MTPETTELINSIIPVLSVILGTIVGVAGTITVTYINKRSEERKHLSSLSFNAGIENFKESINLAIAQKRKASILPLELYILNMKYLTERIQKRDIGKDELKKFVIEKKQIIDDLTATIIEIDKKSKKPNNAKGADAKASAL